MMIRSIFRRAAMATWVVQAGLVFAAQEVITPETIPLIQWAYAMALSIAGGAASSLTRYAGGAPTMKWHLELARDFVCSVLAGVLTMLACLHFAVPPLLAAIFVALAGWGGSKTLEWAFERAQRRAAVVIDPPAQEPRP
jgi:hypothetical protein